MLVLLSPAKKLDFEKKTPVKKYTTPDFLEKSELLIHQLRQYNANGLAKLMNLSYTLAELNYQRNLEWARPFNTDNAKQAIFSFNGDVYEYMASNSLSEEQALWAQDHFRILSGLYGLLRPLDLIQPYRLEMGTKLATPEAKTLYHFWTQTISSAIENYMEEKGLDTLVNLASNEYMKAVDVRMINKKYMSVAFKDLKNGKYRVIGYPSKRARGMMARFIIDHKITHTDDLKAFDKNGYRYCEQESDFSQMVFIRD